MVPRRRGLLFALCIIIGGPSKGPANEPRTARDYYERGLVRETNKEFIGALADYSLAIELDPQLVDAWFSRSSLYAEQRKYLRAVADLTKVIEMRPADYPALFNRALCYENVGNYDKAIADYSAILTGHADFSRSGSSREKDMAHAHHYRGRAYQWYKRDYAKAIADFTEALKLDPEIEMVRYRRGDANHSLRDYAKAEEDYAAALRRDPNYPNLLNSWAWQMSTCPAPAFRNGKRAVEMATKANERFSYKLPAHVETLAAAYAESGLFEEAAKWETKALELIDEKSRDQREAMQERLALYRAGRAFREEPAP